MVGAARLELTTPRSQSECATNCATPRHHDSFTLSFLNFLMSKLQIYKNFWGERWGLNPRPPEPQPGALPTELRSPQ